METLSTARHFEGIQGVYRHDSGACHCPMTFAVYLPPDAAARPVPVLWYLSGLTCSHANVMDKGQYQRVAAECGVAIVCPDTSPRGEDVPDEPDNWQMGQGAGFYLDATQAPWSRHYQMASYVLSDLPAVLEKQFSLDLERQSIFGHSMGGHGAITLALKNPGRYRSCSAFAPIANPSAAEWSRGAFTAYLGDDESRWRAWDTCALIEDGHRVPRLLVDQGEADGFLDTGLMPQRLEQACQAAGIDLQLRLQAGYDHSYAFISTFMEDHIRWHAEALAG